jgi:capsular polysaccharide transport system permease protein
MGRARYLIGRLDTAFSTWGSIILLLMIQHFNERFRRSRIGIVFAFTEPILVVITIVLFRLYIRIRLPDYGESLAVFISSGVLPYYVFLRVLLRLRAARLEPAQRLPRVGTTDVILASTLAEAGLMFVIIVAWFTTLWLCGLDSAKPVSSADCVVPLFLFVALGVGIALVNSAITRLFQPWAFVFGRLTYGLMFLSGVFYVVDLLPLSMRNILVWNPLVHGVEWFRVGLYGRYPAVTLDREYLMIWTGCALLLGIVVHRGTLRLGKV